MTLKGPEPAGGSIAVIGGGVAGLTCAHRLRQHGFRPIVYEKSRGLGGRLATRRTDDAISFDLGAQYVTARSSAFRRTIRNALERGAAAVWQPARSPGHTATDEAWLVGVPTMPTLLSPLADGLPVRLEAPVTSIRRDAGQWRIQTDPDRGADPVDGVVCTVPAPQARPLLADEPDLAGALEPVTMAPCWALMVAFAGTVACGFDVRTSDSHDLAWLCRNSAKPGRNARPECWVVHASPAWSREHLELEAEHAAEAMLDRLPDAFGCRLPAIALARAHRWRYARTTAPLGRPYAWSSDRTLFVGGDWCLGARVEAAFESGLAMADAVAGAEAA